MRALGVAAVLVLAVAMPLYGTFVVIAPHPPIPPLVPRAFAYAGLAAVLVAMCGAAIAAFARPIAPRLRAVALAAGLATILAAIVGYDPLPGIALGALVLGLGCAFWALLAYADAALVLRTARAFTISSLLACALALAMLLTHRPGAIYAYDNGRAVGSFLNPNELACFTLLALGVAAALAGRRPALDRALGWSGLAVASITLLATWSRWGLVSALAGLVLYAVVQRRRAVVLVALALLVAGAGLQATGEAQHHAPRDLDARRVAWQTGLAVFLRHPLIGVGPLAYDRVYDAYRPLDAPGSRSPVAFDPHGIPQAFLASSGVVGFGTLLWSIVAVLRETARRRRRAAPGAVRFGDAILAGFVAVQVMVATNTISIYFSLSFQGIALVLAALEHLSDDA